MFIYTEFYYMLNYRL